MKILDLSGTWELQPVETFRNGFYPRNDGWLAGQVPGHWQELPALRYHAGKVVYRRRFAAAPEQKRRYWLRLNGVFYWSRAWLNGVDLGLHEGYFAPQEHDITRCIANDNLLVVEVDCPDERTKVNKRMVTGVFGHWDCIDPTTNPGGIWLPVELHATGAARICNVRCTTQQIKPETAAIHYAFAINADAASDAAIELSFAPHTFAGEVQTLRQACLLRAGQQIVEGTFALRDPRLWWSHDMGEPHLYEVTARIVVNNTTSDEQRFRFGVRTFELRDWIAHLNGERLLIKGNNYGPGDTRIARMERAAYDRDISLAVACNLNLLRVHAHVEHPTFYEAADAAGLLVWQDFPLQWHYRREVQRPAEQQVRQMIDLLHNHPSVVVWCMHNEPVYLLDTKDERALATARTLASAFGPNWNRGVLDVRLKQIARQADPSRPAVRASGEYYVPGLRDGGDGHFYFGWYLSYGRKRRFDELRRRYPLNIRFVTEFGAQSFPNYESCARFMPTNIEQLDVAQLTDRHHFQPEVMANWYDWKAFNSLEELIAYSQEYQSEINRFYIDRLRYHKYRPTGGIVPFIFNDSNPAVQWSVIDYWRVPKRSYYALQLAFSPTYIFVLLDSDYYTIGQGIEIPVYVVNDRREPIEEWLAKVVLCDPHGTAVATVHHSVSLAADSLAEELERLRFQPSVPGMYRLKLRFEGQQGGMEQEYTIEVAPAEH